MNKIIKSLLALSICTAMLGGCAQTETGDQDPSLNSTQSQSSEQSQEPEDTTFTIEYPASLVAEYSFEPLVLEEKPEDIIILSASALQIADRFDVMPIAHYGLDENLDFSDELKNADLPVITAGMSELDTESIIAMQPDLLILGAQFVDDYATIFEDASIPTYFVEAGPSVGYNHVKEEALMLAEAFGGEAGKEELEAEFLAVETRAAEFSEGRDDINTMILFSTPPTYQQTSQGYLGSMLEMLPINNMSDEIIGAEMRTAPLDFETLITADPELLFAISPMMPSAEAIEASYAEEMKNNPDIYAGINSIQNGNIIYLSNEYVTAKGINIIESVNSLIDMLEEKYPADGQSSTVTIEYPQNMQDNGFVEPVVLESTPQRVISLSTSPVLAMNELGINFVAVPSSSVVTWPDNMANVELLNTAMNSNFDIETAIALSPDLVILGYTSKDTYGKVLEDSNIPVYYVDAGHTVTYDSIKSLTVELIEAFGANSEAGKEIMQDFADLEARLVEQQTKNAGRTVMVLQSAPPSHYIQTKGGTLGSMLDMMGFTNVFESDAGSMVQLDFEQALGYDPDLFFATGRAITGDEFKAIMEADYASNQSYWDAIPAIEEGETIYLPTSFVSTAGINVIDKINELIDIIEEHDAR